MTPYLKIWATGTDTTYPVVKPGSVKRDFLTDTYKAHGYHCQPISTANLHGWDFILPQDVEVMWNGVSNTESTNVEILSGGSLPNGQLLADTRTANATIAFNLHCYLETDPDHYLLLSGPPNVFIPGAKPMSALIRTDWYHYTSPQFCWKLTTPNKVVKFPAGTPFLRVINYPIGLLESTEISLDVATDEMKRRAGAYAGERNKFYGEHPDKWPFLYKKQVESLKDDPKPTYRPNPKTP